ncbi:MAG: ABC transporter permease [Bacteroidota bacterium]
MSLGALGGALEQGLVYAVMALGVYLTFRVLNFPDLTVDGSFPLGAAAAAKLICSGVDPVLATVVAPVLGFVAGATTGVLNTKLKISGLLAGILTMTALYSVNLRVMGRANIPLLRSATILTTLRGLGIPGNIAALLLFLSCAVAIKLVLDAFLRTEFGLALRATGDNEVMIRSLGVNTDSMKIVGLGLSNALVALSGAMVAQYQGFADIGMGIGMVVAGLASVIIGGAIFAPTSIGLATFGAVAGSVVYRFAVFFALRLGFAPTDLKIVTAALVVVALSGPAIRRASLGMERRRAAGHGKAEASSKDILARNH